MLDHENDKLYPPQYADLPPDTEEEKERKKKSRLITKKAIRNGILIRGNCANCGSSEKIHAHHHDYDKPLDVIWLCASCHAQHHYHDRIRRVEEYNGAQ